VKARVKVKGAENVFFDISNADFVLADSNMVVSVDDVTLRNDVLVYPNPAVNQIHVENKGRAAALSLELYSAVGQRIWSGEIQKQVIIPVAAYARGMYYLKISDGQKGAKAVRPITLQ
jgi:hypothetical protein